LRSWHTSTYKWFYVTPTPQETSSCAQTAIAGQDEPSPGGDNADPVRILGRRRGHLAGRTLTLLDHRARITGIGEVGTDRAENFGEPEHIGVEVDANGGWSRRRHAASFAIS
jgi:hypothetical protein